jgi:hypothetical protein
MPPRPSATGSASGPAVSQPRRGSPGFRLTVTRVSGLFRMLAKSWRNRRKYQFALALLALNALLRY